MIASAKILVFNRWVIATCDDEIGQYYRSLYTLEYFYKPRIQKPIWGSHVSVVRGECDIPENFKGIWNNTTVSLDYDNIMESNGVHFWLPVKCKLFNIMRAELGLGPPICDYHLSIGNICDGSGNTTPETFIEKRITK